MMTNIVCSSYHPRIRSDFINHQMSFICKSFWSEFLLSYFSFALSFLVVLHFLILLLEMDKEEEKEEDKKSRKERRKEEEKAERKSRRRKEAEREEEAKKKRRRVILVLLLPISHALSIFPSDHIFIRSSIQQPYIHLPIHSSTHSVFCIVLKEE